MKRTGTTLVELAVVMFGLSVVTGCTVVLMSFILHMNDDARQQTYSLATLGRLAEQFRRDVHRARDPAVVSADHQSAQWNLSGDSLVKWRIDERDGVVRTEHGGRVAERENAYHLPKGTTTALELELQGKGRIVVLRIESPDATGPSLSIEALAARDERPGWEEKP